MLTGLAFPSSLVVGIVSNCLSEIIYKDILFGPILRHRKKSHSKDDRHNFYLDLDGKCSDRICSLRPMIQEIMETA